MGDRTGSMGRHFNQGGDSRNKSLNREAPAGVYQPRRGSPKPPPKEETPEMDASDPAFVKAVVSNLEEYVNVLDMKVSFISLLRRFLNLCHLYRVEIGMQNLCFTEICSKL